MHLLLNNAQTQKKHSGKAVCIYIYIYTLLYHMLYTTVYRWIDRYFFYAHDLKDLFS